MRNKTIFHIDMDQFFAAIEMRHHPHLKGKPVVVGGGPGDRGIVTTASYEARRYGLHSGMPVYQARRLCPQAIFLTPNIHKYVDISRRIFQQMCEFAERVEPTSVDEAYLDMSDHVQTPAEIEQLAMKIKRRILQTEGLTATVGVGVNRLVAKIASGMNKPDGFTYLPPDRVIEVFRDMPVGDLHGIGRATQAELERLGIRTAGQLAAYPLDILRRIFGKWGEEIRQIALGQGQDTVMVPEELPDEKSMGHEHTFSQDLSNPAPLLGRLHLLCERVARRLREANMIGQVVTLKLRYQGFITRFHGRKLKDYVQHETVIYNVARILFQEIYDRRPVRLVGINVSNLTSASGSGQLTLFPTGLRLMRISKACDQIKDRFGEKAISYANGIYDTGSHSSSGYPRSSHRKTLLYRPFHGP